MRDVLHNYARPGMLRHNPLLRSRLILDRSAAQATEAERVAELQRAIQRAADLLQAHPRETKWHRAVCHTYLQPAATQEQAAEIPDVPFSSYRRHLKAGLERITELL